MAHRNATAGSAAIIRTRTSALMAGRVCFVGPCANRVCENGLPAAGTWASLGLARLRCGASRCEPTVFISRVAFRNDRHDRAEMSAGALGDGVPKAALISHHHFAQAGAGRTAEP